MVVLDNFTGFSVKNFKYLKLGERERERLRDQDLKANIHAFLKKHPPPTLIRMYNYIGLISLQVNKFIKNVLRKTTRVAVLSYLSCH